MKSVQETPPGMGTTVDKAPQLPLVVRRERLLKRLEDVVTPGIVVVSAQAAQGKSTLVADHLARSGARSCWIRLRPDDNDPARFGAHLAESCRPHRSPSAGTGRRGGGRPFDQEIADLLTGLAPDLHLVLDDWHHIEAMPSGTAWIETLLTHRPPEGCLYLLSRTGIPLPLQRNRMRRQALVIDNDELAFTPEEIGDFLRTMAGAALSPDHCRRLHDLTGGWTGGLLLLSEELHRHPGDPEASLLEPDLPERIRVEAGFYFREEVYENLPPAMRTFLIFAALAETAEADLLRRQLGRGEADRCFSEASHHHLFLQVLNREPAHWRFRFNPLFRAFLLSEGEGALTVKTRRSFLREAARRYEATDDVPAAVHCLLEAGDAQAAAIGITRLGFDLAVEGRFAEIADWLALLAPATLQGDPWLAMLKAITFRIRGGQRTIGELEAVKKSFETPAHLRERMIALAYLLETAVFTGSDPARRALWIAEAENLLRAASPLPHFTYAKALLWQQVGFAAVADAAGDLQKGLSACQSAVLLGKRIHAPLLVANALTVAAHGRAQAGEFDPARENLEAAENLAGTTAAFPEYSALRELTHVHLELIDGSLASAENRLKRVAADIEAFGLVILYPACLEASGLVQIYGRQYAALEKTRRHLRDVGILLNNPVFSARAAWLAGLSGYHQGGYDSALAVLRSALPPEDLPAAEKARHQALTGMIELNRGRLKIAAAHLEEALAYFDRAGLGLAACETRIGLALVQHGRKEDRLAKQNLARAFQTATDRCYRHLPVMRPADLTRACALSLRLELPTAADHARHFLSGRQPGDGALPLEPDSSRDPLVTAGDAGGTRELLYRARIPVLSIRTFGGLQVLRHGTDPIAARDWQGSRPALLLKAILVHGGRHIPKDILIEALWPDQHPENALRTFKVTLHRLRKLLEPGMTSATGSAYIHLKDNLVSLDPQLCQVDTTAFHHLCKAVRRIEAGSDPRQVLALSREAESLYQGDFLPEEPYLAWAEMKRSTLREEYLQAMYRLARIFRNQRENGEAQRCYRRILQIDGTQEKAQRCLMRLLAEAGRPAEAVRLYRRFQTTLESEVGEAPDETTTELYHSLCRRINGRGPMPEEPQ